MSNEAGPKIFPSSSRAGRRSASPMPQTVSRCPSNSRGLPWAPGPENRASRWSPASGLGTNSTSAPQLPNRSPMAGQPIQRRLVVRRRVGVDQVHQPLDHLRFQIAKVGEELLMGKMPELASSDPLHGSAGHARLAGGWGGLKSFGPKDLQSRCFHALQPPDGNWPLVVHKPLT